MEDLVRLLTGRPLDLLQFDAVRDGLWLQNGIERGVVEVPLEQIVGSLGREHEFTRAFLPRAESLRTRWESVRELAEGPAGFGPVELYQVGQAFFVIDGHHRVSVARSLGAATIEARVREFPTPIPLDAGSSAEDVLLKRFLADFLIATGLTPADADEFRVTVPHGHERLLEHIQVHRYYLGQERDREVPWADAVSSWHDGLYRPTIETIRRSGIMEEFPGRSPGDLYLFVMDHLHHLRERYGRRDVGPEAAARHFAFLARARRRDARSPSGWLRRLRDRHGRGEW